MEKNNFPTPSINHQSGFGSQSSSEVSLQLHVGAVLDAAYWQQKRRWGILFIYASKHLRPKKTHLMHWLHFGPSCCPWL